MASKLIFFLIVILLPLFISPTAANSLATLCNSTPYPSYCQTALSGNQSSTVYDYGRTSLRKSLFQSNKFLTVVNKYLSTPSLSVGALRALRDCQTLAALNVDFLLSSILTVNRTSEILPTQKADDVHTLLSALLTNQQTCADGLRETSSSFTIQNGISSPLSNDSKLYSVSLALFTKGWLPKRRRAFSVPVSLPPARLLQTNAGDLVKVSGSYTVSQDGTGNFATINDAISAAPNNSDGTNGYFMVYVRAGVYQEYVNIGKSKTYLLFVGDGINQTIITGNRNVVDGWTTFNSATFVVTAPNFIGMNFTVRNTAGPAKHQAVALRNGADLSAFYSCSFEGYQDTLYTHSLRQFYSYCDVYGTVDFIFGNAAAVFQHCNLYPRLPMAGQFNAVTAQGRTDPNQNTGTSMHECNVKAADDLAPNTGTVKTYLGRPWKEYSRTVFMQSYLDGFIDPAGWKDWNGSSFALSTLYYAEYGNSGPGSGTSVRVNWPGYHIMGAADASNFTVSNFIVGDSWLPQTGVPYTGSLV